MHEPLSSIAPLPRPAAPVLLVFNESHLGNFVLALPMLERLYRYFQTPPDLLIESRYAPLLAGFVPENSLLAYPSRAAKGNPLARPFAALRLLKRLRRIRYELVVDLLNSVRSTRVVRLCRSRWRIALETNRDPALFTHALPPPAGPHCADRYARVLALIGETGPLPAASLQASAESRRAFHRDWLARSGLPEGPYAALHPTSGKEYRRWPPERFAETADHLVDRHNLNVLLIGSASEAGELEQIRGRMKHAARARVWQGPVDQLLALLEGAEILIANESGPSHLACATRTPVVAIFGPSDEREWHPMRQKSLCVLRGKNCDPACHPARCLHGYPCLSELKTDQVTRAADGLLSAGV